MDAVPDIKSPVASMNRRKTPSSDLQSRETEQIGRSGEYAGIKGPYQTEVGKLAPSYILRIYIY